MKGMRVLGWNLAVAVMTILMVGVNSVHAADWESISKAEGSELWVDTDSYADDDVYSSIWTKTLYKPALALPGAAAGVKYVEKRARFEFDCVKHAFRLREFMYYGAKGELLSKGKGEDAFVPVAPQSAGYKVGTLTCQVRRMVRP
jgi:hypothetical protein